jgi:sulfite exporter TauE/SafE/copper chaperone CopZ
MRRLTARPQEARLPATVNEGERTYHVSGMHCPACEIVVEKKLIELDGVRSVEASVPKGTVLIEHEGRAPAVSRLNELFKDEGYAFSLSAPAGGSLAGATGSSRAASFSKVAIAVIVSLVLIVLLQKAGLTKLVTVNSRSALPAFLLLGLVAGFSSCAALAGGLVLSMSKQWGELHSPDDPLKKRLEPHLLFNTGRLISYAGMGALVALIGSTLRITPTFSAFLVIAVSLIMVVLALQMLGVRFLQRFQATLPKSITRFVADENNFKGRHMPFTMGALTFFLPCGFTMTALSFALLSGNAAQGSLIMLFFALGTLPMLLLIGLASVKFMEKPRFASTFLKVAAVVVLFFAVFNINNQLAVLNAPNLGSLFSPSSVASTSASGGVKQSLVVDGKQVITMEASASDYSPDSFTVKVGVPVRWEIKDVGTSGCTNAVISKDLFSGQIALTPGTTSVKEFTPAMVGQYEFSCWMGMVRGSIDVVDSSGKSKPGVKNAAPSKPAGGG